MAELSGASNEAQPAVGETFAKLRLLGNLSDHFAPIIAPFVLGSPMPDANRETVDLHLNMELPRSPDRKSVV